MNSSQPSRFYRWLDRFERGFAVFVFIYFTGMFFGLVTGDQFLPPEAVPEIVTGVSNPVASALQLMMYTTSIVMTLLRWRQFLPVLLKRRCLLLIVILALSSCTWSMVPMTTFRQGINLTLTAILAMYLAKRFTPREQLELMGWAFGLFAVLNFLFTVAFPSAAIHQVTHAGAWRGLSGHKNGLAQLMTLSSLIFLLLTLSARRRLVPMIGLVLSVALVLLSTSKTALSILTLLFVFSFIFRGLRWRLKVALPIYVSLFLLVSVLSIAVIGNFELILTSMGRDATLTGRTEVWGVALAKIPDRIWVGYGYQSFWLQDQGDSAEVFHRMNWQAAHGHNGYIDILLDLGVVGLGCFVLSLVNTFRRSILWMRLHPDGIGMYPFLFCSFILLYNFTESSFIVEANGACWLMYVLASTTVLIQPIPILRQLRSYQASDDDQAEALEPFPVTDRGTLVNATHNSR